MKNSTLKDQWELYKCAGELAHFGILMDFIKQSANQFYDSKAKKEKIEEHDIDIFTDKFDEIKIIIESLLTDIK
jgi:hypothetical protein